VWIVVPAEAVAATRIALPSVDALRIFFEKVAIISPN
jgi:hypothetical protein